MTDWSGHIDVVVLIFIQVLFNIFLYKKIQGKRSIIYYGENEYKPSRHDSSSGHSSSRIDRVGHNFKR